MYKDKAIEILNQLDKKIIKISEILLFLASLSFIISINLAILSRLFSFPVSWVEDYCRFVQVWVTMLGVSCAVHSHAMPAVEFLLMYAPKKIKIMLNYFIDLFTIVLGVTLISSALSLIKVMGDMNIASMEIFYMKYFYAAIPTGGVLIIYFSIQRIVLRSLKIDVDSRSTQE